MKKEFLAVQDYGILADLIAERGSSIWLRAAGLVPQCLEAKGAEANVRTWRKVGSKGLVTAATRLALAAIPGAGEADIAAIEETDALAGAAEAGGEAAAAGAGAATEAAGASRGVSFIGRPNGDVVPVPEGAAGPTRLRVVRGSSSLVEAAGMGWTRRRVMSGHGSRHVGRVPLPERARVLFECVGVDGQPVHRAVDCARVLSGMGLSDDRRGSAHTAARGMVRSGAGNGCAHRVPRAAGSHAARYSRLRAHVDSRSTVRLANGVATTDSQYSGRGRTWGTGTLVVG
jgi:hypothetical protein